MSSNKSVMAVPRKNDHYSISDKDLLSVFNDGLISKSETVGFIRGNIFKYIYRFDKKGTPKDDLNKAKDYINRLLEMIP